VLELVERAEVFAPVDYHHEPVLIARLVRFRLDFDDAVDFRLTLVFVSLAKYSTFLVQFLFVKYTILSLCLN